MLFPTGARHLFLARRAVLVLPGDIASVVVLSGVAARKGAADLAILGVLVEVVGAAGGKAVLVRAPADTVIDVIAENTLALALLGCVRFTCGRRWALLTLTRFWSTSLVSSSSWSVGRLTLTSRPGYAAPSSWLCLKRTGLPGQ